MPPDRQPLVTIGLPVYNGARYLRAALESLLAQNYPRFELVISDNASTDETPEICQQFARDWPNVRYVRQAENIGMVANFLQVVELARGEFFQWAADDDSWDSEFLPKLVARLVENPAAILATPMTIHWNEDGSLHRRHPDRPATDASRSENLKIFLDDHAIGWLYGLWRTEKLKERLPQYFSYPLWGGDVLWLADLSLRDQIVGDQLAIFYKRYKKSGCAPRTARGTVTFWYQLLGGLLQIVWRASPDRASRWTHARWAWDYFYRLCLKRSNLPRTVWRAVRMLSIAAVTSIPSALAALWRRASSHPEAIAQITQPAKPPTSRAA